MERNPQLGRREFFKRVADGGLKFGIGVAFFGGASLEYLHLTYEEQKEAGNIPDQGLKNIEGVSYPVPLEFTQERLDSRYISGISTLVGAVIALASYKVKNYLSR